MSLPIDTEGAFKFCATMIEWDNREQTVAEWADEKEIPKETLRARIKKYGICKKVFYKRRLTKEEIEVLL